MDFFFTILKWGFRDRVELGIDSLRDEVHDSVKWGGIFLLKAEHIMMLFESQEMSLEFNCSLPRRNPERAGSLHHAPLPAPSCTHLLSLWSVEERWARTYSGPGCLFHLQECWPEWCPGERVGLQRSRVCSCLCPCRKASMERCVLRVWFTSPQMGKKRWEGGEWGNGGCGVSHLQCVISPPSIVLLLPVCLCLLSHLVWSDSLRLHGR